MKALADELDELAAHYARRSMDENLFHDERMICLGRTYAYTNAARLIRERVDAA